MHLFNKTYVGVHDLQHQLQIVVLQKTGNLFQGLKIYSRFKSKI